jgi:hypothetical protein
MQKHVSQSTAYTIPFQHHTGEVRPKPAKMQVFTPPSSDFRSSFCQFRSDILENLVDNPVYFSFHEEHISSNIHRGQE